LVRVEPPEAVFERLAVTLEHAGFRDRLGLPRVEAGRGRLHIRISSCVEHSEKRLWGFW